MVRTRSRPRSDGNRVEVIGSTIRNVRKVAALALLLLATRAAAVEPSLHAALAGDDGDARDKAIAALSSSGDPRALPILEAWRNGNARHDANGRMFIVDGDAAVDAATGSAATPMPADL